MSADLRLRLHPLWRLGYAFRDGFAVCALPLPGHQPDPQPARGRCRRVKVRPPALTRRCRSFVMLGGRAVGVPSPRWHGASSRRAHDRWQGGVAVAAVERQDRQVRGDPDGARGELLVGMALRDELVGCGKAGGRRAAPPGRPAQRSGCRECRDGRCSPYARSVPPAAALIL